MGLTDDLLAFRFTSGGGNIFPPRIKRRILSVRKVAASLVLIVLLYQRETVAIIWEVGNSFDIIFGSSPNQF